MKKNTIDRINQLLLKEWDPIGIGDTVEAQDEYSQYAYQVYNLIQHSNSYRDLFEYLWDIETRYMGLKGNRTKTEKFAQMLFNQIQKSIKHPK